MAYMLHEKILNNALNEAVKELHDVQAEQFDEQECYVAIKMSLVVVWASAMLFAITLVFAETDGHYGELSDAARNNLLGEAGRNAGIAAASTAVFHGILYVSAWTSGSFVDSIADKFATILSCEFVWIIFALFIIIGFSGQKGSEAIIFPSIGIGFICWIIFYFVQGTDKETKEQLEAYQKKVDELKRVEACPGRKQAWILKKLEGYQQPSVLDLTHQVLEDYNNNISYRGNEEASECSQDYDEKQFEKRHQHMIERFVEEKVQSTDNQTRANAISPVPEEYCSSRGRDQLREEMKQEICKHQLVHDKKEYAQTPLPLIFLDEAIASEDCTAQGYESPTISHDDSTSNFETSDEDDTSRDIKPSYFRRRLLERLALAELS